MHMGLYEEQSEPVSTYWKRAKRSLKLVLLRRRS